MPFDHITDAAHREQLNQAQGRLASIIEEIKVMLAAKRKTYSTLTAAEKDCVIGDMALATIESLDHFLADSEMLIEHLQDAACVVDIDNAANHPPIGHDHPDGVAFFDDTAALSPIATATHKDLVPVLRATTKMFMGEKS